MTDQPNTQAVEPDSILVPPPERAAFTEETLPGEPTGDRKLILESGMEIRERLTITDQRVDGVQTGASNPASVAFTILISSALLDENGKVATTNGQPVIAPAHEISLTNEALGRLGTQEAVDAAIRDAREVAAARAEMSFKGALLAQALIAERS